MSLRNYLRRKVHCLRRSPRRQDAVFTLYTSHALIRLRYGLAPVVRSMSVAKEDTFSWLLPTTLPDEHINGSKKDR